MSGSEQARDKDNVAAIMRAKQLAGKPFTLQNSQGRYEVLTCASSRAKESRGCCCGEEVIQQSCLR